MSKELERLKNKNLPCANCKSLKALEIIKENLVISYDESEPCLMLGIKVGKDKLVIIYETFDREKIDLLKEVLLWD